MTASQDGHVKFWKKNPGGIYFVKNYKAHLKAITSLSLSTDHLRLCSTSLDKAVKFYDVLGFDMINMLTLEFTPNQVRSIPVFCKRVVAKRSYTVGSL